MTIRKIPVYVYSRVVGYFQPIQNWNKGKKEEFSQRKEMSAEKLKQRMEE
jgi:anaerobic ribonucleoside-triphosphate reductase